MLLHIKIKEIKELNNCKSNNLNLEIKQIQYKVLNEMKWNEIHILLFIYWMFVHYYIILYMLILYTIVDVYETAD